MLFSTHMLKNVMNKLSELTWFNNDKSSKFPSNIYLGILVDSKLTWKPHITELSKKLARTAGIFSKSDTLLKYVSRLCGLNSKVFAVTRPWKRFFSFR